MTVGSLMGELENVHIPLIATIAFFSAPCRPIALIGLRFEGAGRVGVAVESCRQAARFI